jgi:hypothetical protein
LPVLQELGFEPFGSDTCIFKNEKTGALLILYVDDLLISGRTLGDVPAVRDALRKRYELKDMGEAKRYLGLDLV